VVRTNQIDDVGVSGLDDGVDFCAYRIEGVRIVRIFRLPFIARDAKRVRVGIL